MVIERSDQPEREVYERNPLKAVVAQVKFPAILSLADASGVAALQEAIREQYPFTERLAQISLSLGEQPAAVQTQTPTWRFLSEDRQWIASVSPETLSIETPSYRQYEPFRERFSSFLATGIDVLRLTRYERFGLRYVNVISHPEAHSLSDWRQFLSDRMLGFSLDELFGNRVEQSFQQIRVALANGKANVRHGFLPQPGVEDSYVIDIDVYDEVPKRLQLHEVLAVMDSFKAWEWRVFRSSINARLREYLRPTPNRGPSRGPQWRGRAGRNRPRVC